jgi:hypothetical protein
MHVTGQYVTGGSEALWMQMFLARPRLASVYTGEVHGMELTDNVLLALAENCSGMKYLSFRAAPTLTDAGITAVAQGCSKLCSLNVEDEASLTDAALYALAEHSKHLERLSLKDCTHFTVPAIMHLLRCCTLLDTLHISEACLSDQAREEIKQALSPRSICMR